MTLCRAGPWQARGAPLCFGCAANSSACDALWRAVWGAPSAQGPPSGQGQCTNCSARQMRRSLAAPGTAPLTWPPGIGHWFSTPANSECSDGGGPYAARL